MGLILSISGISVLNSTEYEGEDNGKVVRYPPVGVGIYLFHAIMVTTTTIKRERFAA